MRLRNATIAFFSAGLLSTSGFAAAQGSLAPPDPPAPPPPVPATATAWGAGRGATESAPRPGASTFDPSLPAAITTIALGGTLALGAAASLGDEKEQLETCGLSGCLRYDDPSDEPSWGPAVFSGGLTTAAGGAALLVASHVDPARHADAGRARLAAGAVPLSLGLGLTVMGATAGATGHGDGATGALIGVGVTTSAIAVPFVAWGAATWDESRGDAYASNGRIVSGAILTGVGVLGAGGAAVIIADNAGCAGELCGFGTLLALPLMGLSGAGLGIGLPLLATGSQLRGDTGAVPEIRAGAASIDAKWRFQ